MFKVDNLSVAYGGIHAVHGASLVAHAGQVTSIIGRNGSGKSSLVDGIAGLVRTTGASIVLDGKQLNNKSAWRRARAGISLVPEDRRIFRSLSVRENLELAGVGPRAERLALLESVLNIFPALDKLLGRAGDEISGGQQQMVAIGRGLMRKPRLLILDEPSLGLAPLIVEEVFEAIRTVSAAGQAVLLIEQNAPAALAIADQAYAMSLGTLRSLGPEASTMDKEELIELYL
jgi:branched-chain amino acid transport system ATP-binding protein